MKIIEFDKISSTQDEAEKYVATGEETIVLAREQTGGKGTKGRSFVSKRGGLYFSHLVFYDDFPAKNAHRIIENYSVAVALALKNFGIDARIKWPNDIMVSKKKICGILTRSCIEKEKVLFSVTGIGINVNNEITGEIADIAVSMKQILGYNLVIDDIFRSLTELVKVDHDREIYKKLSCILNERIYFTRHGEDHFGVAKDILPDGSLLLDSGETLTFEEIKII